MESHGGNVELLGDRGRRGQAAAGGQLQVVPRVVVHARAGRATGARGGGADLEGMDVEGVMEEEEEPALSGIPLPIVQMQRGAARGTR